MARRANERAVSIRAPGELSERQTDPYVIILAALGNAITACAAGIVGDHAAAVSCGLLSIGALLLALAGGREYRGLLQQAGHTNSNARLLLDATPDYYASQLGFDAGPKVSEDLVEGYTTTVSRLPSLASRADDDSPDTFLHLAIQGVNKRIGEVLSAMIDMDTLTSSTTVSSVLMSTNDLNRRQSIDDFTAYYSWDNWEYEVAEQFPRTESAQTRLAQDIHDYMVSENGGAFCANLAVPDFNGIPQPVNNGYSSFISGTFTDQKASC